MSSSIEIKLYARRARRVLDPKGERVVVHARVDAASLPNSGNPFEIY